MKRDRPVNIGPIVTVNNSPVGDDHFLRSLLFRPFSFCMCGEGERGGGAEGEGGKEIKVNGKFPYQYPILTSCGQLPPLAKSDV